MNILPIITGTILAVLACVALGIVFDWLREGLIIQAAAHDLISEHGAGAVAEVERLIDRATWRCDRLETEFWRKVASAVERLLKPSF